MRLFGFEITRRPPRAQAQTHVVVPRSPGEAYNGPRMASHGFRRGQWVMRAGWPRAGILTGLDADDVATVMMTQEDGTNLAEVQVAAGVLRQAAWSEIPEPRRQHRPVEDFEAMGYRRTP